MQRRHVVYANDRSRVHSGPFAAFGNRGTNFSGDPTISKTESGHPIDHKFTSAIPTSQCINCHIHPGTTVLNSYIGYMWWDEETVAKAIYPARQNRPTAGEVLQTLLRNPNESAARSNLADPEFVAELAKLNPELNQTHFGDFHSHGWAFRAVFKKDRDGRLIDHAGKPVGKPTGEKLAAAVDWPNLAGVSQAGGFDDPAVGRPRPRAETKLDQCRSEAGPFARHPRRRDALRDCHFAQDMHGNNRLHVESGRDRDQCIDCHGTVGVRHAQDVRAGQLHPPDGRGTTCWPRRRRSGSPGSRSGDRRAGGTSEFGRREGAAQEVVRRRTQPAGHPLQREVALAKTVRVEPGTARIWGDLSASGRKGAQEREHECIAATRPGTRAVTAATCRSGPIKSPILHADDG